MDTWLHLDIFCKPQIIELRCYFYLCLYMSHLDILFEIMYTLLTKKERFVIITSSVFTKCDNLKKSNL